jgi:hypothetical protein
MWFCSNFQTPLKFQTRDCPSVGLNLERFSLFTKRAIFRANSGICVRVNRR